MKLVLTPQTLPDVESANVIGDIKGSEHPEQVVIVSGHLDSWDLGTGAIDDGAGVAVPWKPRTSSASSNLKPKRTIRVIAWMNEENGTRGSKDYAKDHEKDWANHFAAMETDIGADHPVGLNVIAKPEVKTMFDTGRGDLARVGRRRLAIRASMRRRHRSAGKSGGPERSAQFRTAASILIITTPRRTRSTRSIRKTWRKRPRLLRFGLRHGEFRTTVAKITTGGTRAVASHYFRGTTARALPRKNGVVRCGAVW